jgi:AraC family transcriptional regulator
VQALATVSDREGVRVTEAEVNGLTLAELRFAPGYVQEPFEPESPYLAVVLDGGLQKAFRLRTMAFGRAEALVMPAGATHGALFGPSGAQIVIVKPRNGRDCVAHLDRLTGLRGPRLVWLAWRLAAELRASDSAAPLAAEGLALELIAAAGRESAPGRPLRRPPLWLSSIEELLAARLGERVGLSELAGAVGMEAGHVARVFRAHHGVSVGEYARRQRLAWAAGELARGDEPLALIARRAGFADQSHFTRLFKQHVGTTPARYRVETRGAGSLAGGVQEGGRATVT